MNDTYRVLPHHDVGPNQGGWEGSYTRWNALPYQHKPCGCPLSQEDIENNWCPQCPATINKAAQRRAQAEWKQ